MQLVCVDRRYQRMNCFNIRELQGVLKRKFFTDLVNTTDHRDFLNQSIIGLRFKSNNQLSITPDVESFFNLGLTNVAKTKTNSFINSYNTSYYSTNLYFFKLNNLDLTNALYLITNNLYSITTSINFNSILSLFSPISILRNILAVNFSYPTASLPFNSKSIPNQEIHSKKLFYTTENINTNLNLNSVNNTFLETSNNVRFTRFNNPLISYDYKCGHYLGI
jgi:hypothetical protein